MTGTNRKKKLISKASRKNNKNHHHLQLRSNQIPLRNSSTSSKKKKKQSTPQVPSRKNHHTIPAKTTQNLLKTMMNLQSSPYLANHSARNQKKKMIILRCPQIYFQVWWCPIMRSSLPKDSSSNKSKILRKIATQCWTKP